VSVKAIHDEIHPPSQTNAAIRYLKVAERAGWYTIGVFVFPPHVTMPIHDHPGMVCTGKMLWCFSSLMDQTSFRRN
jgi:predicted metal-dependent enzyme (double-stranded beta helix superfamily)